MDNGLTWTKIKDCYKSDVYRGIIFYMTPQNECWELSTWKLDPEMKRAGIPGPVIACAKSITQLMQIAEILAITC